MVLTSLNWPMARAGLDIAPLERVVPASALVDIVGVRA
jgi:hypothetical protein